MTKRYWLIHANGGRQWIDRASSTWTVLPSRPGRPGGDSSSRKRLPRMPSRRRPSPLVLHPAALRAADVGARSAVPGPPGTGLCLQGGVRSGDQHPADGALLGGYYRTRRLVRVYSHDRQLGRRPLEELFDTFLHEMAHHIEYTEPGSFHAPKCERVRGRMHSGLFWRILGELKGAGRTSSARLERNLTGKDVRPTPSHDFQTVGRASLPAGNRRGGGEVESLTVRRGRVP